jgi:hypothetical protein
MFRDEARVAHICLPLANVGLLTLLFDFVFAPALDVGWFPTFRRAAFARLRFSLALQGLFLF